jgi:hypothetical protein
MSYMIKHPINATPFRMAVAYNSTDITITAGLPKNTTLSLNTLVQSSGMGLTLATNQITLVAGKTYLIYYKVGITNGTENRGAEVYIQKNGVTVSNQPNVPAITTSSTIANSAWMTPNNVSMAVVTASSGDYISFLHTRSVGASYPDTVTSVANKAFILELA